MEKDSSDSVAIYLADTERADSAMQLLASEGFSGVVVRDDVVSAALFKRFAYVFTEATKLHDVPEECLGKTICMWDANIPQSTIEKTAKVAYLLPPSPPLALVRLVLRRGRKKPATVAQAEIVETKVRRFQYGHLTCDFENEKFSYEGTVIHLTPSEQQYIIDFSKGIKRADQKSRAILYRMRKKFGRQFLTEHGLVYE